MPLQWVTSIRTKVLGTRIRCDRVVERLWDYLDDEIDDPAVQRKIAAHLEICARCFPEHEYRRALLALPDRHAEDPMPPGLRRSVFESLIAIDRSHA